MAPKSTRSKLLPLDPLAVKRMAVEAIGSDTFLADRLVFKGGSALELLFGIGSRASVDLDFSIEGDFREPEIALVRSKLESALTAVFGRHELLVFDLQLEAKPAEVSPDLASFWGGYGVRFKLIDASVAKRLGADLAAWQRNAMTIGPAQRRTFEIDISRYELCREKEAYTLNSVRVFAYSPRLIVAEKLRAICQQEPAYRATVRSPGGRPRSRDFFDIYNLVDRFSLVLSTREFYNLLLTVFEAKRVPIDLLWNIRKSREFHRSDFESLRDTVPPGVPVLEFDEYFDHAASLVGKLQAFGNK